MRGIGSRARAQRRSALDTRLVLWFLAIACLFACVGSSCDQRPACLPEDGLPLPREEHSPDNRAQVRGSMADDRHPYGHVATISRDDEFLACYDFSVGLGAITGTDLTGTGTASLLVERHSGGAHCRHYDSFCELDDELTPGGNRQRWFENLDGDGVYESTDDNDSFAYEYCAHAGSPAVKVILVYRSGELAYVPASCAFPKLYREEIERDTAAAEHSLRSPGHGGWHKASKSGVLPLVLDYLSSSRIAERWPALDRYSDREAFREEIRAIASASWSSALSSVPIRYSSRNRGAPYSAFFRHAIAIWTSSCAASPFSSFRIFIGRAIPVCRAIPATRWNSAPSTQGSGDVSPLSLM
jgi:hypothetical protein